jgi:hypothetical protein
LIRLATAVPLAQGETHKGAAAARRRHPCNCSENLQIRVGSAITRAPAARLIKGCRGGGEVLKSMNPGRWIPVFGKDHAQMQIEHANRDAIVTIAAAALPAVQIRRAKCPR